MAKKTGKQSTYFNKIRDRHGSSVVALGADPESEPVYMPDDVLRKSKDSQAAQSAIHRLAGKIAEQVGMDRSVSAPKGRMKHPVRTVEKSYNRPPEDIYGQRLYFSTPEELRSIYKLLSENSEFRRSYDDKNMRLLDEKTHDYINEATPSGCRGFINFKIEKQLKNSNRTVVIELQVMPHDMKEVYDRSHELYQEIRGIKESAENIYSEEPKDKEWQQGKIERIKKKASEKGRPINSKEERQIEQLDKGYGVPLSDEGKYKVAVLKMANIAICDAGMMECGLEEFISEKDKPEFNLKGKGNCDLYFKDSASYLLYQRIVSVKEKAANSREGLSDDDAYDIALFLGAAAEINQEDAEKLKNFVEQAVPPTAVFVMNINAAENDGRYRPAVTNMENIPS